MNEITALNNQYGIGAELIFEIGAGGQIIATINNEQASASIALQGAHLMTWQPAGSAPAIWLSPAARFAPGKSIRGGVPICWPWFGAHSTEADFPAHGFARTTDWHVINSVSLSDGTTQITFELTTADMPTRQWPQSTSVQYQITIGKTLSLALITRNSGQREITISEALHTYFAVSDVRNITIGGLDGCHYLDKAASMREKQQEGDVTFTSEVDRVYINTEADCVIRDPALSRQIRISKTGGHSTVVWNPWIDKATQMGDMGEDGHLKMVCVESANAANNFVAIQPGNEHLLMVNYSIETIF